ncbi:unnamed protein product, partial [Prorocentrum cordatum]
SFALLRQAAGEARRRPPVPRTLGAELARPRLPWPSRRAARKRAFARSRPWHGRREAACRRQEQGCEGRRATRRETDSERENAEWTDEEERAKKVIQRVYSGSGHYLRTWINSALNARKCDWGPSSASETHSRAAPHRGGPPRSTAQPRACRARARRAGARWPAAGGSAPGF